jgi:hypothetical protein
VVAKNIDFGRRIDKKVPKIIGKTKSICKKNEMKEKDAQHLND